MMTRFLCVINILISMASYATTQKSYIVVSKSFDALKQRFIQLSRVECELQYLHEGNRGFVAKLTKEEASSLKADGSVTLVEENQEYHLLGELISVLASDAPREQQLPWGITAVKAPEANSHSKGEGVTVCVVDTGIQKDHPDLKENIKGGKNFVPNNAGKVVSDEWGDDHGHGTHVSGTIAALDNSEGVVGVAPKAGLYGVKVLSAGGSGTWAQVADGIRSCIGNAQVISMSLGGSSDSELVRGAVKDAQAAGLTIVAAAGNSGSEPILYPARYDEVKAVSAVDSKLKLATFSSRGPEMDYAGPGVDVLSSYKGGTYATYSGTSMACPHVSAVVALHLASKSKGVVADVLEGLNTNEQGNGFVNALSTVTNQ